MMTIHTIVLNFLALNRYK